MTAKPATWAMAEAAKARAEAAIVVECMLKTRLIDFFSYDLD